MISDMASHIRIYGYSDDTFARKADELIGRLVTATGIKALPVGPVKEFLTYALRHKYNSLTFQEIELAFLFNATGEYGEVVQHYQEFNITFLGAVLAKYLDRKRRAMELLDRKKELPAPTMPTPEQLKQNELDLLKGICAAFENYKKDKNCQILFASEYLKELVERGFISKDYDTDYTYIERATEIRKARLSAEKFNTKNVAEEKTLRELLNSLISGKMEGKNKGAIKSIARDLVLRNYFEKWKNENFNLQTKLLQ